MAINNLVDLLIANDPNLDLSALQAQRQATNPVLPDVNQLAATDPTMLLGALMDAQATTQAKADARAITANPGAPVDNAAAIAGFAKQMEQDPTMLLGALLEAQANTAKMRAAEDALTRVTTPIVQSSIAGQQEATIKQNTEGSTALPVQTPDKPQVDSKGRPMNTDWTEAIAGVGTRRVDGKLQVSNVKGPDGQFTMDDSWYYRSSANPGSLAAKTVASQMASIQSLPTVDEKMVAFQQLQVDAARQVAEAHKQAVTQAEEKLGVPALKALLARNEAADRNTIEWQQRRVDSKATAQVRQQLENAMLKADGLAKSFLNSNTEIAGLQASLKTAEYYIQRSMTQEMRIDDKKAAEEFKLRNKKEEIMARYRPQHFSRARILDPALAGMEDTAIVDMIANGKKAFGAEQEALLAATEDQLLSAAVAGNNSAHAILVQEEAAKSGLPADMLSKRLSRLSMNATPEAVMASIEKSYPDKKSPEYQAAIAPFKLYKSGTKLDKDSADMMHRAMLRTAQSGLLIDNTREWIGDVRSWVWTGNEQGESRIKSIVDSIKTVQGETPVSLDDIVAYAKKNYDRKEWSAINRELRSALFANKKNGLLTQVDADMAAQRIQAEFTKGRASDAWAFAKQTTNNTLTNMANSSGIIPAIGTAYDFLFGSPLDTNK